jgi:hypothetical protein
MKINAMTGALLGALLLTLSNANAETPAAKADKPVHGEYKDWRVLGVSHRTEKNTLRSIVGNDKAIEAARSGKINPWPDGAVIGKIVWKERPHPNWPSAIVPGEFSAAEAMIKDSKKFAETGGWGFGHWEGDKLVMNSKEKSAECFACHTAVKDADYVFTIPALP